MEKQKKSYGKTALIVLLLIVTIASLVLATYAWAKYSSVSESSATAQVAKWNVKVDFTSNQFEETYEHVVAQRLAPGMEGSFEITVNRQDTEVDFDYEIIFEGATAEYVNDTDKTTYVQQHPAKVPAHLHFYTNSSRDEDHEIDVNKDTQTKPNAASDLKGNLKTTDSTETKTIYWKWPYEDPNKGVGAIVDNQKIKDDGSELDSTGGNGISDYDDQDTLDGMHPVKVTVKFKVVATQQSPTPEE